MKKIVFLLPKLNFFLKIQCTAGCRPSAACKKVYKHKACFTMTIGQTGEASNTYYSGLMYWPICT